jgi:hypothetical protein
VVRKGVFSADYPAALALRAYLVPGSTPATEAETETDATARAAALPAVAGAMGHYLYGRRLVELEQWAQAARELAAARAAGLTAPLVQHENDRLLLKASFLAGDLATARAAARRLDAPDQLLRIRLDAEDWLARIAFAESYRGSIKPPD